MSPLSREKELYKALLERFKLTFERMAESDKEKKFKLCISEFETNQISFEQMPWDAYRGMEVRLHRGRSYRGYQEDNDENYFRAPGLNTTWLKEILLNLPALAAARSAAEKTSVINFWEQATNQVIYELGDINESSNRIDQYPNEFSVTVLRIYRDFYWHYRLKTNLKGFGSHC